MAKLVNVATKQLEDVPDAEAPRFILGGTHAYEAGTSVNVVSPQDGNTYSIPAEHVSHFLSNGSRLETAADIQDAQDEAQFGDRPLAAGVAGAARGASFGLSDYLAAKLGYGDPLRKLKERNETASMVGEIGGVLGSAFLPGPNLVKGVSAVGEGVAHVVAPLAERVIGAGAEQGLKAAAQRIAGEAIAKGAGSAIEGALYGAGQTLSEDSLGEVEANGELLASQMGISALIGGAVGAAIPVASGLLKGGSKLIPGWTQPGEDGYEVTKRVNKLYNKASTLFGADEATASKFFNDAEATKSAFAMGEKEAAGKIADTADKVISAGDEAKTQAYQVLHGHALEKAANEAVESGNLAAGQDLIDATNKVIGDFDAQVQGSPKFYSANTKNGIEIAQRTLEGESPALKSKWGALREELNLPLQQGETAAITAIPEGIAPEQAKKIVALQYDTALSARKQFDKAISTTEAKMAAGGEDTKLYLDMRKALNEVVKKAPGFGEDISRLNEVYSSYAQNFEKLQDAMSDRAGDLHIQKAMNLMKASGAKGSMVDNMLESAGGFVDRLKQLQEDAALPQAVKEQLADVTGRLEDNYNSLSQLREAGRNYGDLQELKRMAGPSGSGAGMIGQATLLASGHAGLSPLLAPATSPYYYLKGLNTLRGALDTQLNADKLARIERIIGGQNRTIGDVAANAIKSLASGVRIPAILSQAKDTEAAFKERQMMLRAMQYTDPTELYQGIHNLVGAPAPAHAVATASVANRAVQYLQANLPQGTEPPPAAIPFEKKVALPSKVEMARFNSIFDTVNDPKVALEALGNGTLKAEQVEALKAVYPKIYQQVSQALITYLAKKPDALPYQARLRLGTWFSAPTTKELAPSYLQAAQSVYGSAAAPADTVKNGGSTNTAGLSKITIGQRTTTPTQSVMQGRKS